MFSLGMTIAILVLGVALAALAIGLWWWKSVALDNAEQPFQKPAARPQLQADISFAGVQVQVCELLQAGKKIEAIKLVRQHTDWGLKESKDYVDKLQAGELVPALSVNAPAPPLVAPPPDLDAQVLGLLAQRKKIEAIKLVRQHTDWGLKEAKDYVERLE